MSDIVVFGGTGFIGSKLVARLSALGHRVRVPTRHRERARHLLPLPTVEVVEVDTFDAATLDRLLRDQHAVANLVGVLQGRRGVPYGPEFARAHQRLPANLAQACITAGVPRLVHVSALGADSAGASMYLRSKGDGEAALRAQPGLRWTILRPSVVFGDGDSFLNTFAALQRKLPLMLLGGAHQRFAPVWVGDVAAALSAALVGADAGHTVGRIYELGGPREYTLAELVRLAGAWAGVAQGRGRPLLALPDGAARVLAALLEHLPGDPLMSRDNLDSMREPNVPGGVLPGLGAPELGVPQPRSVEAVAPDYLGAR
jgi:NADH dehydrogenase